MKSSKNDWREYEREKQRLLSAQDQGTPVDYERSAKEIAEKLGL